MTTDLAALKRQLTNAGLPHGPLRDALDELARTRAALDEAQGLIYAARLERNAAEDQEKELAEELRAVRADRDRLAGELAAARAALDSTPGWLSNCVVCARVVDTREQEDGGDPHGCEYDEGWVCSAECGEVLHPTPPWMTGALDDALGIQSAEADRDRLAGELAELQDAGHRALALLRADGRGDTDIAMSLCDALKGVTP